MSKTDRKYSSIVLGGGCFWCLDAAYRRVKGVQQVVSGYADGDLPARRAEVVQLTFDDAVIGLPDLLEIFWSLHDPTSLNRQMYDVGAQYRSTILYDGDEQKRVVEASLRDAQGLFDQPIVTVVKPLDRFHEAPAEHQDFYNSGQRPDYCELIINPKLAKLRAKFAARLK